METQCTNSCSLEKEIDVLIDMARKLSNNKSIEFLDLKKDIDEKLDILQSFIFSKSKKPIVKTEDKNILVQTIKEELSDIAAKSYIENEIKKEVLKKMQKRESEYLEDMKLQIINSHIGVENASTLKKYANLEKKKSIKLKNSLFDTLRPTKQNEIIGQDIAISSIIEKLSSPYPQHIILYGPPGVGKTSAARLALEYAKKSSNSSFAKDAPFVEVDGTTIRWDPREAINPLLGSVHDPIYQGAKKELAEIGVPEPKPGLVTEAHGGVLFIDEIGELDFMLQNKLLKVLEDKKVSFDSSYYDIDNKNIPKYIKELFAVGAPADFVLIGATTRLPEEINPALRSRCAEIFFDPLDETHIKHILDNASKKLCVELESDCGEIISSHTYEARRAVMILADCYSKAINKKDSDTALITKEIVYEALKLGRYKQIKKQNENLSSMVGKVFGLGVLGFIGSIIEFEAVSFIRKDENGKVRFNETAGSMTKDSVFNALSSIRYISDINPDCYDIHVNCIGGGKIDGPSAGVAIFCVIYSCIMDKPFRLDTCMTGEISIRGDIKPVGGIYEKVHAAKRAGYKNAIVPKENELEARQVIGINIIPVGNILEVIEFMNK